MREIKFRAWDEHDKKMWNPDEVVVWNNNFYINPKKKLESKIYGWSHSEKLIMQYTGLKDKTHLKDIVFGDVVIVDSPKGPFKSKITQEVGAFGIVAIDGQIIDYFEENWNDDFMSLLDLYWNFNNDDNVIEQIEVIGNIYENPELLETKKD